MKTVRKEADEDDDDIGNEGRRGRRGASKGMVLKPMNEDEDRMKMKRLTERRRRGQEARKKRSK